MSWKSTKREFSVFQSSESTVPSENRNLLVTPSKLANCKTTVWHVELIGDMISGRQGMHSGRNSILSKDGEYSDNTARQNTNLQ